MKPFIQFIRAASCLLALFMIFPAVARADGIEMGVLVGVSAAILIPLTAFVVLVESIFLSIGLKLSYSRTLGVALGANIASLLTGIPVKIFNAFLYWAILPWPLPQYFRYYPYAVILGTLIYFVVTLIVEYFFVAMWCRKRTMPITRNRIAKFVLIANVATYSILAPVHYYATRPTNQVRNFTDDTKWAQQPATKVYYISDIKQLCSIMTDGRDERILIPRVVENHEYQPEPGITLKVGYGGMLSLVSKSDIPCSSTLAEIHGDENSFDLHRKSGRIEVYRRMGLGSYIHVSANKTSIRVADDPGLLKLGNRGFHNVCILDNEKEIVFDDHRMIYLMDVDRQKIGSLAQGTNFITVPAK